MLFAEIPHPFLASYELAAPWALLGEPLDRVLGDAQVIEPGAQIHPSVVIDGPVFIAATAQVRPGAFIRGGAWIGPHAVVGANTEVKRGILFERAQAPHLNYVGDSILGKGVNLGAGCVLSNHRHDRANVTIDGVDTGRRKLGAILGDDVKLGCTTVTSPGVIIGQGTHTYSGVQLRRGSYPAHSVIKLRQELDIVARR